MLWIYLGLNISSPYHHKFFIHHFLNIF